MLKGKVFFEIKWARLAAWCQTKGDGGSKKWDFRLFEIRVLLIFFHRGLVILQFEAQVDKELLASMPPHLTDDELNLIDKICRTNHGTASDAFQEVNKKRKQEKIDPVGYSSVAKYVAGETHLRGVKETRGRPPKVSERDAKRIMKLRRRMIQERDNQKRVTWEDLTEAADLDTEPSVRVVADALRARGVRFHVPRKKVFISKKDAKKRLKWAKEYVIKPPRYWTANIHAFMDTKSWLLPLTEEQKKKYFDSQIPGHLRLASEGTDQGFTKAKVNHMSLGIPSIDVTAAVAKNRIIMWHYTAKHWNGDKAAKIYKGPLLASLKRVWPGRRAFTVVEDGDRKGWQSGKGLAAKDEAKITAVTLPPRSPSLMPLDYSLWRMVEEKMKDTDPGTDETKDDFKARLKKCALSLPKAAVAEQLRKMKTNLQGIVKAKGFHAKND